MNIDGNEVVEILSNKIAGLTIENANLQAAFNKLSQERVDLMNQVAQLENVKKELEELIEENQEAINKEEI